MPLQVWRLKTKPTDATNDKEITLLTTPLKTKPKDAAKDAAKDGGPAAAKGVARQQNGRLTTGQIPHLTALHGPQTLPLTSSSQPRPPQLQCRRAGFGFKFIKPARLVA